MALSWASWLAGGFQGHQARTGQELASHRAVCWLKRGLVSASVKTLFSGSPHVCCVVVAIVCWSGVIWLASSSN